MRVHQAEKRRKGMDTVQNRHNRITFIAKACICIFAALVVFGGLVVKLQPRRCRRSTNIIRT